MSGNDKRLFLFSFIGLILFACLSYAYVPKTFSPDLKKDFPVAGIKQVRINGSAVLVEVPQHEGKKVQYILFNNAHPDTLTGKGNFTGNILGNNRRYLMAQSSAKFMPPAGKIPMALVMGTRYINKKDKEAGQWSYHTQIIQKHTFNIVSIMCDPEDLFGFEGGVFVAGNTGLYRDGGKDRNSEWWLSPGNWSHKGKEWERPVHFQLLSPGGQTLYESGADLRVHGNGTRGFAQKSMRLTAAKKYGKKVFDFSFFKNGSQKKYAALVLRNGGNDWGRTMFADRFIQSCLPADEIDRQEHEPVVVYINGLYWGIYSLCEKLDEKYLARKYDVKTKNITLLEGQQLEYGSEEEQQNFISLVETCKKSDFARDKNYQEFCSQVDINNFALYLAIQMYIVNTDLHNQNVRAYKAGKNSWRWTIRDLDCSYSYSGNQAYETDMFARLMNANGALGFMFSACMKNKNFRQLLREKCLDLLSGPYSKSAQLGKLQEYEQAYTREIEHQANRWRKPSDTESWKAYLEDFRQFILKREPVFRKQIQQYLGS